MANALYEPHPSIPNAVRLRSVPIDAVTQAQLEAEGFLKVANDDWDASGGLLPAGLTPGQSVTIGTAGTVGGVLVPVGAVLTAKTGAAANDLANWTRTVWPAEISDNLLTVEDAPQQDFHDPIYLTPGGPFHISDMSAVANAPAGAPANPGRLWVRKIEATNSIELELEDAFTKQIWKEGYPLATAGPYGGWTGLASTAPLLDEATMDTNAVDRGVTQKSVRDYIEGGVGQALASIGYFWKEGEQCRLVRNPGGLTVRRTAGTIARYNQATRVFDEFPIPAQDPALFSDLQGNGTVTGTNVSNLDFTQWDNAGTLTAQALTNSSTRRAYIGTDGTNYLLWGETPYTDFAAAMNGWHSEEPTMPGTLTSALLVGTLLGGNDLIDVSAANAPFRILGATQFGHATAAGAGQISGDPNLSYADLIADATRFGNVNLEGIQQATVISVPVTGVTHPIATPFDCLSQTQPYRRRIDASATLANAPVGVTSGVDAEWEYFPTSDPNTGSWKLSWFGEADWPDASDFYAYRNAGVNSAWQRDAGLYGGPKTLAEIKAFASSAQADGRMYQVSESGKMVSWRSSATDGIVPDDNPTTGRWVAITDEQGIPDWTDNTDYKTGDDVIATSNDDGIKYHYQRIADGMSGATFDPAEEVLWNLIGAPPTDLKILDSITFTTRGHSTSFTAANSIVLTDKAGDPYDMSEWVVIFDSANSIANGSTVLGQAFDPPVNGTRTIKIKYNGTLQRRGLSQFQIALRGSAPSTGVSSMTAQYFDGSSDTQALLTPRQGTVIYDINAADDWDFFTVAQVAAASPLTNVNIDATAGADFTHTGDVSQALMERGNRAHSLATSLILDITNAGTLAIADADGRLITGYKKAAADKTGTALALTTAAAANWAKDQKTFFTNTGDTADTINPGVGIQLHDSNGAAVASLIVEPHSTIGMVMSDGAGNVELVGSGSARPAGWVFSTDNMVAADGDKIIVQPNHNINFPSIVDLESVQLAPSTGNWSDIAAGTGSFTPDAAWTFGNNQNLLFGSDIITAITNLGSTNWLLLSGGEDAPSQDARFQTVPLLAAAMGSVNPGAVGVVYGDPIPANNRTYVARTDGVDQTTVVAWG